MRNGTFNPMDYGFSWTADGWYAWDRKAGHSAALKARNTEVKRLRATGFRCFKSSSAGQLITRGGIGSGHPQIEAVVTVYHFNAR